MEQPSATSQSPLSSDMLAALHSFAGSDIDSAIVLGSGLGSFARRVENVQRISTCDIPDYPVSTVEGHAGEIAVGTLHDRRLLLFVGRLHGYEGYSYEQTGLPARIASALGARRLILTNAAGGLNPSFSAGDFMLVRDFIVLPLARRMGLDFQGSVTPNRVRSAFDEKLLGAARHAFMDAGIALREGVYGYCSGPTYETRAEIAMFRAFGADAVGMSTVAEIMTALSLKLPVIAVSCITNKAVTVTQRVSHQEVTDTAERVGRDFARLLHALLQRLADVQ
jgi:purine-nucleoside phosphorylase